nr:Fe2+-dependent dioxygenase [Gammaproteobacteria bacterium]
MLVHIPSVLTAAQIETVNRLLSKARFVPGGDSAGMAARRVKRNRELAPDAEETLELNRIVMGNLVRHPTYKSAALPLRVAAPFYASYEPGMAYGDHVDDPVMGSGERYRSDLSITVFLNEPEAYDGGELVIRTTLDERHVKLPAGDVILYPSHSLHRVSEVT